MTPSPTSNAESERLIELVVKSPLDIHFTASTKVTVMLIAVAIVIVAWQWWRNHSYFRKFEVDQAEIGIGSTKFKLTPNEVDREIAYKIWVELSTRKIGLEIDLEHDVIFEVYDSWHAFFSVTRELIKDVPVSKFRRKGTQEIIKMSIGVLNDGLRPHLTRWQARFRRWYEQKATHTDFGDHSPQDIQAQFPKYDELRKDLMEVNQRLMAYRKRMFELITSP